MITETVITPLIVIDEWERDEEFYKIMSHLNVE